MLDCSWWGGGARGPRRGGLPDEITDLSDGTETSQPDSHHERTVLPDRSTTTTTQHITKMWQSSNDMHRVLGSRVEKRQINEQKKKKKKSKSDMGGRDLTYLRLHLRIAS